MTVLGFTPCSGQLIFDWTDENSVRNIEQITLLEDVKSNLQTLPYYAIL